jgi:predicted Rossmann fold nucleotide-binding protein DprA/Smf involved in DNA uptake
MKLAVIGSRKRNEVALVASVIREKQPTEVISGGADGIDTNAETVCRELSLPCVVIRPQYERGATRASAMRAIRLRNEAIIESADVVAAFPSPERKGGTEMGIRHARKIGKPVFIY